jgi:TPR repeat protein
VIDKTGSNKSCNIMAEFNHAQDKKPGAKELAAKYYQISHEKGCQIGSHWLGVFHHEGFGVNKNVEKAIELLKSSGERGNGQSMYQLHLIYCSDEKHKDVKQAYVWLTKAV